MNEIMFKGKDGLYVSKTLNKVLVSLFALVSAFYFGTLLLSELDFRTKALFAFVYAASSAFMHWFNFSTTNKSGRSFAGYDCKHEFLYNMFLLCWSLCITLMFLAIYLKFI